MTQSQERFQQIVNEVPGAIEGKMFGAACIKSTNGKAAAILWKDNMLFKLDETDQLEAQMLEGSSIGYHLYAPEKPMKGWVSLPSIHSDQWANFTKKAVAYVSKLG